MKLKLVIYNQDSVGHGVITRLQHGRMCFARRGPKYEKPLLTL